MSNARESCTTQIHTLDIDLAMMRSDPERVIRNPENQSFFATFHRQEQKVEEKIDTLDKSIMSEDEGRPSIHEKGKTLAPESIS